MIVCSCNVLSDNDVRTALSQEQFTYRGRTMYNTNHLLGKMPGVDGLKTGFTNAAGFNLAASAMRRRKGRPARS